MHCPSHIVGQPQEHDNQTNRPGQTALVTIPPDDRSASRCRHKDNVAITVVQETTTTKSKPGHMAKIIEQSRAGQVGTTIGQ